jgi:transcriptional regulator with XRE-family HTH domain
MDQNVMDNVSSNMRRLRKKLDMSQEDIAQKLHIARPVISNWERGIGEPSTSQLARLAQTLNVSLDVLVNNEIDGKQVAIIDTSMLIKRPVIIREITEKFDEIIVPQVVIDELNHQKDNAKPWLKRQAALIMHFIDDIKNKNKKIIVSPASFELIKDKNDVQIANIAIERASRNFSDKIYVFANDIWFSFLVNEKRSNIFLLGYAEYKAKFLDNEDFYNAENTQKFMSLVKNKDWEQIKLIGYDPEIDINYVDPEIGYTPLIQAIRHRDIEMVHYMIEKYKTHIDLDRHDNYKYKFTPLLHTAQIQNLDMMKLLVESGADINLGSRGDNDGNTPLMVCAWHGFYEGVKFLVEQGACLNQQDGKNGFTALMKACIKGNSKIAALLIEGTDLNIPSRKDNKKAVEYINPNNKNNTEMYKIFKDRT